MGQISWPLLGTLEQAVGFGVEGRICGTPHSLIYADKVMHAPTVLLGRYTTGSVLVLCLLAEKVPEIGPNKLRITRQTRSMEMENTALQDQSMAISLAIG